MRILAIDPGCSISAWLVLQDGVPTRFAMNLNTDLVHTLSLFTTVDTTLAIEFMRARGMPISNEELETQFWAGRFVQAFDGDWKPVYRSDVKLHLCGQARAKDANVRAALIEKFGGKDAAVGTKKEPGPLYGIKKDVWSALAIAVTFAETR